MLVSTGEVVYSCPRARLCARAVTEPLPCVTHMHTTDLVARDEQGATSLADEALGRIAETGHVQCVCMCWDEAAGGGPHCIACLPFALQLSMEQSEASFGFQTEYKFEAGLSRFRTK